MTNGTRETTLHVMPIETMGAVGFFKYLCQKFRFFANLNIASIEGIDALSTEGVVPLDASIGEKIGHSATKPGVALGDVREILAYFR